MQNKCFIIAWNDWELGDDFEFFFQKKITLLMKSLHN
jgi:hypothetical protein